MEELTPQYVTELGDSDIFRYVYSRLECYHSTEFGKYTIKSSGLVLSRKMEVIDF